MFVHAMIEGEGARVGKVRERLKDQVNAPTFAGRLWQVFGAVISRTSRGMEKKCGRSVEALMQVIDQRIHDFLVQSLQLDTATMGLEYE